MSDLIKDRSPATVIVLSLGGIYVLFKLIQYGITAHRQRLIATKNGCKPIKKYPHLDPIFGLDLFFENKRLSQEGRLLSGIMERYLRFNTWTYSFLVLGDQMASYYFALPPQHAIVRG